MNISIASKRKQRSLAKSILGENLVVHSQSDWMEVERRFVKCYFVSLKRFVRCVVEVALGSWSYGRARDRVCTCPCPHSRGELFRHHEQIGPTETYF